MKSLLKSAVFAVGLTVLMSTGAHAAVWSVDGTVANSITTVDNLVLGAEGSFGTIAASAGITDATTGTAAHLEVNGATGTQAPGYGPAHFQWGLEVLSGVGDADASFSLSTQDFEVSAWAFDAVNALTGSSAGLQIAIYDSSLTLLTNSTTKNYFTFLDGLVNYSTVAPGRYVIDMFYHAADGEVNAAGFSVNAVPIPPAALLLVSGVAGLIGVGRRKRSKVSA